MQKSHRRRAANLRPSADWDWVWDWGPLGHAWITPGSPKRHAWVTQGSIGGRAFVCNKSGKKAGWGRKQIAEIAKIG